MQDDGVIKFRSVRRDGTVALPAGWDALNRCRSTLHDLGLIGVLPDGIGYGNLSLRGAGQQFVISASATGAARVLEAAQYSLVESFSVEDNCVHSVGPMPASSESLTHGAIYAAHPGVQCVLHGHHRGLFDWLLQNGWPATPADVAYGTPEMARAVQALVAAQPALPVLFAMAGHQDGVVAYGRDIASTCALICDTLERTSA